MEKKKNDSYLPWILIPIGGLIALAGAYLVYFLLFRSLQRFFINQAQPVFTPMALRAGYALILWLAYAVFYRSRASDLLKAMFLPAPMATTIIAFMILFYQNAALGFALAFLVSGLVLLFLARSRKPWFYYYAAVLSLGAALFYGWPAA
ncbi:hypothetical protein DSECCO2_342220 [anaerobic digester metagenome]|nr:hypothetical protein NQU17_01660 [Clostridiaceae bacterium HFYG-1003]